MENIKYVVSVDDCFAMPNEDTLRTELLIDLTASFDTVKPLLINIGKKEQVEEIQELIDLEMDVSSAISDLVDSLQKEKIEECLNALHPDSDKLSDEQKGILTFLEKIKSEGIIEKFITISSTHEAELLDTVAENMTDGAILWLIDKSFSNAKESSEAGVELAKNLVKKTDNSDNYIFMLTTINSNSEDEAEIAKEFDNVLAENNPEISSFIYYINKNQLTTGKDDRVARSLAFGFKRKKCYELMSIYSRCLNTSCSETIDKLHKINQKTLNHLFSEKVDANGESHFDFFTRLVKIFFEEEYSFLLSKERTQISSVIDHYRRLSSSIKNNIGDYSAIEKELSVVRKKELYDMFVNPKHCEISTGDIFKVKNDYYILVTQACDTYLRIKGERKLDKAILLKIEENPSTPYKYELSCFCDAEEKFRKPAVMFQGNEVIPFEILDLCVVNDNGESNIDTTTFENDDALDFCFTQNYKERYKIIKAKFAETYKNKNIFDAFLNNDGEYKNIEDVKKAYTYLFGTDSAIINYEIDSNKLIYPIQRISRLNELTTIDLLKEYGNVLSRIGQPFDFMKKVEEL